MNPAYLACGGWVASAVGAAASFGIADLLAAGPRSVDDLARATGTAPAVLASMMRLLAEAGVFARGDDGRFSNTEESEVLRSDHPQSMRHFCRLATGTYQRTFMEMEHALRSGEPSTVKALGSSLYDYLDHQDEASEIYDKAMEDLSRPAASAFRKSRDFGAVQFMVDVGGGRSLLLRRVLQQHPHTRGIVVDRPEVCARAAADLRASEPELASRLEFRGGSFFEALPPGADLYVLKNVLHNWGDAAAIDILRNVRQAMPSNAGSRLVILEPVIGGHMPRLYQALDGMMQILVGQNRATARSEEEFRRLTEQAGLTVTAVSALESGHTVIEASLPGP